MVYRYYVDCVRQTLLQVFGPSIRRYLSPDLRVLSPPTKHPYLRVVEKTRKREGECGGGKGGTVGRWTRTKKLSQNSLRYYLSTRTTTPSDYPYYEPWTEVFRRRIFLLCRAWWYLVHAESTQSHQVSRTGVRLDRYLESILTTNELRCRSFGVKTLDVLPILLWQYIELG